MGFYTTRIGLESLDYPGLKFYATSPGCTHHGNPEHGSMMENYDVIVIGTGAGGGMAIKTLCEAGLKVCALNAGRQVDPAQRLSPASHAL